MELDMHTRTKNGSGFSVGHFMQHWGLLVLMGVLLCGAWDYVLTSFASKKSEMLADRQRELAQLNSAVAQQTAGLLKLAETDLRVLDQFLQANPKIDPRTHPRFVALVDMLRRSSNGLIEFRMASTEGKLYYVPSLDGKPLADVKNRAYYTAQLAPGDRKLYIADPVSSRVTGKWNIPMSWRLESPVSGMFLMIATIELERLFVLHEKLRLKPAGTIMLSGTNGVVMSRTPHEDSLIGKDLSGSENFRAEYGIKTRGAFMSTGTLSDGVARVATYERLEQYPVIVLVTEGVREVLAPYYEQRNYTYAFGVAITLILLTLTFFLQRFLRASYKAQQELQRVARIDSLTGLLTRRSFLEGAEREFGRALRYARPTMLLALDIDHFKQVNDLHGHATGDTVLRECCAAWLALLRDQDLLGRMGGEEFCAVMPETGLDAAWSVADRLREITSRQRFVGASGEFSVTVSIGLTSIAPADARLAEPMERADKALYAAKKAGRNRVEKLEPARLRAVTMHDVGRRAIG